MQGTNLQHALHLAGRHVRRHPDGEPVVLVVTDGEPTAHLEGGQAYFQWPPTRATVQATVAEVDALTRYGAAINVFMLGEDPGLRRFMDAVARRNGGRVLTPVTRPARPVRGQRLPEVPPRPPRLTLLPEVSRSRVAPGE